MSMLTGTSLDLRYAVRALLATRSASLAVVVVLALGIGTASAIFGMADPFLTRPLPYPDAERLVVIEAAAAATSSAGPFPTLEDWRARRDLFSDVAAVRGRVRFRVMAGDRTTLVEAVEVTENFPTLLGGPALPPDLWRATPQGHDVAFVLLARGRARPLADEGGARPRTLRTLEGHTARLAGVLPASFVFPTVRATWPIDALVPFTPGAVVERVSGPATDLTVVARLQPGVPVEAVAGALAAKTATADGFALTVRSMSAYLTAHLRPVAAGAVGIALLVLLICSANVGNLALARGAYRRAEIATRRALGASRTNLIRLLAMDQAVLAASGVAAGLCVCQGALHVAARVIPAEYAILGPPAMTWRVVAFACVAGAVITLVTVTMMWVSWLPGGSRFSAAPAVSERGRVRVLRRVLLATQSAVAMALLVPAAFLVQSYAALTGQDVGFGRDTVAVSVLPPPERTPSAARQEIETTLARLARLPSVRHAAAGIGSLVDDMVASTVIGGVGRQYEGVAVKYVTEDYFAALGDVMLVGRTIRKRDDRRAVVVSQSLARVIQPDGKVLGKILSVGTGPAEVVGVVPDMFDRRLDTKPKNTVFLSMESEAIFATAPFSYLLRLSKRTPDVVGAIRREIERANPGSVVTDVSTLDERLFASVRARTFVTFVSTVFATAALVVCLAGLGAMVAFTVARRTREIAIRMTLGATPAVARRLVLQEAFAAAGIGIALGLFAGAVMSKSLSRFLYGAQPADPATLTAATAAMCLVVVVAAWIPASKAARLQPSVALRVE
jgi:predicted permease